MGKRKTKNIEVQGIEVRLVIKNTSQYICITDIAKKFSDVPTDIIKAWMRSRNTVEFLGTWEQFHNEDFNLVEFDQIKSQTGLSTFILTTKNWVESTNAIGIQSKAGKYGGTFAHQDIALEFCSYLSPSFKLYFIKEFQRLKTEEAKQLHSEWNVRRLIAKTNYHIHSEAVRENLVPIIDWNTKRESIYHATEADLLNLALFGMTAKEWKIANPTLKGNMRDQASIEQLIVLANLESLNAEYLELQLKRDDRLKRLNEVARKQMGIIIDTRAGQQLKSGEDTLKLE